MIASPLSLPGQLVDHGDAEVAHVGDLGIRREEVLDRGAARRHRAAAKRARARVRLDVPRPHSQPAPLDHAPPPLRVTPESRPGRCVPGPEACPDYLPTVRVRTVDGRAPYRPRNTSVSIASDVRCSRQRPRAGHPPRPPASEKIEPVIAADLIASVTAALDAAGLPVPPQGVEVTPGEVARARRLADERRARPRQDRRRAAARRRGSALVDALEASPPRHVERVEIAGPGFVNFFLAPTWLHDVLVAAVTRRRRVRPRRRVPRRAHQPRVRLGQPDRSAARGRRAVGRGRRRDREPARGAGRGGAPRVLPERRRASARRASPRR